MPVLSIGILVPTNYADWTDCIAAFKNQLVAHHWVERTDFKIEHHSAGGVSSNYTTIANDFANLGRKNPINIILTGGTEPTRTCITATANVRQQIKVFFATAGEPGDYFTKLANNVTGISNQQIIHVKERLKHMKAHAAPLLAPTAFTVFGVIGNANAKNVQDEMAAVMLQAPAAPINLKPVQSKTPLHTAADIPTVIQSVIDQGAQALYVCTDPLITTNALAINNAGLPTMHAFRKNFGGGTSNKLLCWGPKLTDMFSQAADLVCNFNYWGNPNNLPTPTTPTGSSDHQP